MYSDNLSSSQTSVAKSNAKRVRQATSTISLYLEVLANVLHGKTRHLAYDLQETVMIDAQVIANFNKKPVIINNATTALEMNVILEED